MQKEYKSALVDLGIWYASIILTGAAVMMLELLGTRIIGPFYGTSLAVWTALIAVALTALALGYFLGGWLADCSCCFRLPHTIMLAALTTALVPLLARSVLLATDGLGMRLGALVSALILLGAPLTFLAMAGPLVIRLACSRGEGVGMSSGSVYAVSTLGSVVGTLLLGFYLLPVAGSRSIFSGLSLVLWLLAVLLVWHEIRRLGHPFRPAWLVFTTLMLAGALAGNEQAQGQIGPQFRLLFQSESVYGRVQVMDDFRQRVRWMLADASTIGAESLVSGQGVLSYQRVVAEASRVFHPLARDVLLIGLGAGHLVRDYSAMRLRTDIIEIDPLVVQTAREFFGFRPPGKLWVGDARYQVGRLSRRYDLIVHDCFTGGSEPVHLLTVEMITDLHRRLKPGGMLILNYVGFLSGPQGEAAEAVHRTLGRVFPQLRVLISDPHANFNDLVFVASDRPLPIPWHSFDGRRRSWWSSHLFPFRATEGFILTDDYNPLESLQAGKVEAYRTLLWQRLGAAAWLW